MLTTSVIRKLLSNSLPLFGKLSEFVTLVNDDDDDNNDNEVDVDVDNDNGDEPPELTALAAIWDIFGIR
jgi:hypothetical protein